MAWRRHKREKPEPPPRMTAEQLGAELFAEYGANGDRIPFFRLGLRHGLEPTEIARAYGQQIDAQREANAARAAQLVEQEQEEDEPISVETISTRGWHIIDLSSLESMRMRIRGTSYYVTDDDRMRYGGTNYLLVREPDNPFDAEAIAVYGGTRKLGHVSAAKAARLAPLLDQLGADAYKVSGALEQGRYTRVDVPLIPALRAFVKAQTSS